MSSADEKLFIALVLIVVVVGLLVYFVPTMIAKMRGHPDTSKIFLTNLFFGWTIVGLIGSVVWACSAYDKPQPLPRPRGRPSDYPRF